MNSKRKSVFRDIYERQYKSRLSKLYSSSKDDESFVQRLSLLKKLSIHQGCVNTICWNDNGNLILSGSDDQHLMVTNGHTYKVEAKYYTSHHANIFSAKFLPCSGDKQIISCSGDGSILHTDLDRPKETYLDQFTCHGGTTTYEVITIPNDPNTFLSCGEDGTVRWFDLRTKTSCRKQNCQEDILIKSPYAVTALAISPTAYNQLAIGCADSTVRLYDRRYLSYGRDYLASSFCSFLAPHFDRRYRITSLSYSGDGHDMLVSYSSDYLYLFNVQESRATALKKPAKKVSKWNKVRAVSGHRARLSPPPVRRLRLRGDWSDTGPNARPERDTPANSGMGQARPQLQGTLMQRMTDVLSRMLNDPMTRAALSAGGEDSVDPESRDADAEPAQQAQGETAEADDQQNEQGNSSSQQVEEPAQSAASTSTAGETSSRRSSLEVVGALQNHLSALQHLRAGFIEQHGAEPSVSFHYSQQSTSNSTISLRVGGDVDGNFDDDEEAGTVPSTSQQVKNHIDSTDGDVDMEYDEESESGNNKTDKQMVYEAEMKMKYVGHRNARTMIKEATFWGDDYVMSGSDCGHVFIWNRHSAEIKMLLQADQHVVNCLQPHPTLPILATSGIDNDVKLWAPIKDECSFDAEAAEVLINRNAIMLEETRDTITVPAAFMIRMLACLNQIRRSGSNRQNMRRGCDK
ncbi:DDB1- and CUL4-associated factor 6 [Aethina tumida]|uniref:DDB1- and CUL4-associated factor 6 n=1 Tax=Aethina tumida TaxID=116153 RepID=UPI00096B033A|nr:DDB1- and CUL4-associated factor 6 [Aethina tumida]